jgi:hypothetical protein
MPGEWLAGPSWAARGGFPAPLQLQWWLASLYSVAARAPYLHILAPMCCISPAFYTACSYVCDPAARLRHDSDETRLGATTEEVAAWVAAAGPRPDGAHLAVVAAAMLTGALWLNDWHPRRSMQLAVFRSPQQYCWLQWHVPCMHARAI